MIPRLSRSTGGGGCSARISELPWPGTRRLRGGAHMVSASLCCPNCRTGGLPDWRLERRVGNEVGSGRRGLEIRLEAYAPANGSFGFPWAALAFGSVERFDLAGAELHTAAVVLRRLLRLATFEAE